jgi:FlaA1/EpsC-like NDP-sugar epimerase
MTIPEAASLVLKTAGVGESGNLYILDMGDPLLIKDIAEQMIRFYGFEPDEEIPIIYTGIRPGEKFLERLWKDDDEVEPAETERVNILKNRINHTEKTNELLKKLYPVCYFVESEEDKFRNRHLLRNILKEYVPTVERPENEPEF